MTRREALTLIVRSMRKAELCEGCGQLEERCDCQEPLEDEICKRCRIKDPRCEYCELPGSELD